MLRLIENRARVCVQSTSTNLLEYQSVASSSSLPQKLCVHHTLWHFFFLVLLTLERYPLRIPVSSQFNSPSSSFKVCRVLLKFECTDLRWIWVCRTVISWLLYLNARQTSKHSWLHDYRLCHRYHPCWQPLRNLLFPVTRLVTAQAWTILPCAPWGSER
jgi:hypothetical protein